MMNLANAYYSRIRGDRAQNIEDAIAAYQQSLEVRTREVMPIQWAASMMNLANAYKDRIRGDRAQSIEEAIAAYQQSLEVRTREAMPVEWAESMNNLANAYKDRIRGDRAQNIEEAIAAYQQSLEVRTREAMSVEWAVSMVNLAIAYSDRIRGDRAQNIEEAIAAYQQSLQVMTREAMPMEWAESMMNLASAYYSRIRGNRAQSIEDAIAAYLNSLNIFTPDLLPNNCRRTARSLGNLYFGEQRWEEAVSVYQTALQAAETLYQSANLLDSKAAELAETSNLPRRAAYALARTGHLQQAVGVLEQGRARGLSESLDRDRADLTQLQQTHFDLYQDYQTIANQLRNLESQQRDLMVSTERHSLTPEALRDSVIALRQQLTDVIQHIHQIPGYEEFLSVPTFANIKKAVQGNCPLVYLVTTSAGSLALIVTSDTIHDVWLDALNETQLIDLLNQTWFAAYRQFQSDHQSWFDVIDKVTLQLWKPLMAPLIAHLQQHSFQQAILIPTGYLNLLPLHAAWTSSFLKIIYLTLQIKVLRMLLQNLNAEVLAFLILDHHLWTTDSSLPINKYYALDAIHFTYAPNARSLTAAGAIAGRSPVESILAIENPRQDLSNSGREVASAISTFPQFTVLAHEDASVEAVKATLAGVAIAHFSCHGTANLTEPLKGGLLMSDGLLTLRDIFALNLTDQGGLRLAILSACETGLSGIENADEAVSLPTGLLQAGVAAVIASLWSVPDLSTMMLLSRFYDLWRKDKLEPALALRQAQQWVRDTTSQQKAKYFQETNPDIFQLLILLDPNDFAHPFHWAAFSYIGV
jgi:CHAT domain-containing protein